jgi:hypothetical protein
MVGSGPRWELALQVFKTFARRHGIAASERPEPALPHVARPSQGSLFEN